MILPKTALDDDNCVERAGVRVRVRVILYKGGGVV